MSLRVPGLHNVKNAWPPPPLAAALGVSGEAVERGLGQFGGQGAASSIRGLIAARRSMTTTPITQAS